MALDDFINSLQVEDDCWGKWNLDGYLIRLDTRGYADNTANCSIHIGNECLVDDWIEGSTKEDCVEKCRQWYKKNLHNIAMDILQKMLRRKWDDAVVSMGVPRKYIDGTAVKEEENED